MVQWPKMRLLVGTVVVLAAAAVAADAVAAGNATDVEAALERFLSAYYDRYWKKQLEEDVKPVKNGVGGEPEEAAEGDVYETMQGDQPVENNIGLASRPYGLNSSLLFPYRSNFTDQYLEATRNR